MWLSAIEACSSCSTIHIPQQGVAAACAVGLFACVEPDGSNALDDPHLDERLCGPPFVFGPDGPTGVRCHTADNGTIQASHTSNDEGENAKY